MDNSLSRIRIQAYSDTLFRVEYQPEGEFEDKPTLLMGEELPRPVRAKTIVRGNRLTVRTSRCELVYVRTGDDFTKDTLRVTYRRGGARRTWTRGDRHRHPVPEVWRSLDAWDRDVKRHAVPILINSDGWHIIEDNAQVYWDKKSAWPVVRRRPYYQNLYLFFYGDDVRQAFKDYITLFGRHPMIPRQALGAWYSRWHDYKDPELRALIEQYRKHNVPLDVLVVDVDWHKHHWNGYDWRTASFPNPPDFIRHVKDSGMKLVLNDHPGYELYDPLPDDDSRLARMKPSIGEPPYKGMWACDWGRKSVTDKWVKVCLQEMLRQGIDGWWIDGWGDNPFPNVDGQLWLNWQYFRATRDLRPNERPMILSRWGGIGSHRYPVQFSGDTHSRFDVLEHQIPYTAYSGGAGAAWWSHDVGGFHEGEIDEEVYLRWVQFAALSPIFRTHSNHGIREPYKFSCRALEIYRSFIRLRYRLIPYLEQLQFSLRQTGFPLVYPMDFAHPSDSRARRFPGQYYLGSSILVAPVTCAVSKSKKTAAKTVWLPDGRWLDVQTGKWVAGSRVVTKNAKIDEMPLFVREGSILPSIQVLTPIQTGPYRQVTFNVFGTGRDSSEQFWFDDGLTPHDFEPRHVSRMTVECRTRKGVMDVRISADPKYSHDHLPREIRFNLVLSEKIRKIRLNGRNIIANPSGPALLAAILPPAAECLSWDATVSNQ